jgi:ATP synthase protein I
MKEGGEKGRDAVRLARLSSVGISFVLCTFIGCGIGYYIDKAIHTRPVFTIVFIIFGIGAGFLNVYRTITKNTD